jgi:2-keto-3-deoxy-L-rhamnonate aldolase RhmA
MFSPIAAEVVAQAGYDCVLIDLEHGPGWYLDMLPLIHAIQGHPCAPLVRVPSNDPVALKKVLDIGVAGVMVPSVDTAEQAEAAVAACRYPPKGNRGMAVGIVRASDYGARTKEYLTEAEDALMIMCQIESAEAVSNAREIAAIEGVDMLFIGPYDLSASLGHLGEPDHPEARAAIAEIEAAAKSAGVKLGTIPTPERDAALLAKAGYSLVMVDSDVIMLRDAARSSLAALR